MPSIVDVHTHCFPDALAPRAIAFLEEKGGTRAVLDGTAAGLLSSMDSAGIDISVVCTIATEPGQFHSILSWCASIAGPRIIPFPSVHPRTPGAPSLLGEVARAGFPGIKLHPEYQDFVIDEPGLDDLYGEAERLGLVVLFHAGYDIGFPDSDRSSPARILEVHRRHPRLSLIASHLGGFRRWEEVCRTLLGTGVHFDTSYAIGHIGREHLERIFTEHPPEGILFGSDSPWVDQRQALCDIENLGLDEERKGLLLSGNARRLLNLGQGAGVRGERRRDR